MKREYKNLIIVLFLISAVSPFFMMSYTAAIQEKDMKKTAFVIDWIKVSDQLENKYYHLDVGVNFARIYGSYGKVFTTDSNYDDGINDRDYHNIAIFRGGTTNPVNSIIFGRYCDYTSNYCYAPDLSESGYELKVYLKLWTWYSSNSVSHTFGGSIKYNIWYTMQYNFDGYSGALTIRYKVILY